MQQPMKGNKQKRVNREDFMFQMLGSKTTRGVSLAIQSAQIEGLRLEGGMSLRVLRVLRSLSMVQRRGGRAA